MWTAQVRLGAVRYYMFVERDTGANRYFEVPLARAFSIFTEAYARVSGPARTVRGPSMSATPGKVLIEGVEEVAGEKVFVLRFIQARDPSWVGRVLFARYDPAATWLRDLEPAFGRGELHRSEPRNQVRVPQNPLRAPHIASFQALLQTAKRYNAMSPDRMTGLVTVDLKPASPLCDPEDVTGPGYVSAVIRTIRRMEASD